MDIPNGWKALSSIEFATDAIARQHVAVSAGMIKKNRVYAKKEKKESIIKIIEYYQIDKCLAYC